ncbi:MAG TPA: S9 family peptidase, partial [Candidatus Saccharimonadia bacterium]|nr:S9 family peptidase [Candidatus Saccharimonadia bacterium]
MHYNRWLLATILSTPAALGFAAESAVMRELVGTRTSENIPAVPAELSERLAAYQNTRGASFAGWLPDGALLITTRFGNTAQVHRVAAPLGMREQLTFFDEPVSSVASLPDRAGFVFGRDVGGSEFWQ